MANFRKTIGNAIRTSRKLSGFKTQESLALAIGADRTRVSRWESGENIPDPIYQERLIEVLGLPKNTFTDINIFGPDPDRSSLTGELVGILPALNEDQLRSLLALARKFATMKFVNSESVQENTKVNQKG